MVHLLTTGVFVCVLALCDSQGGDRSYFMPRDRRYDSGRGESYPGVGMAPSYMGADMEPSYMRADLGPSYMGTDMGTSYMGGEPSYMGGSETSYTGGSTSMGSRRSSSRGTISGASRDFMDRSDRGISSRRIGDSRVSRPSSTSGRRSDRRRGSRRSESPDRGGDRREYRPPREGYIGAYGGQAGFPFQGGYCPNEPCADGGELAGIGMGYGTGTQMLMDQRLRTGENELLSTYEAFAGGPNGVGSGMTPAVSSPMGGGGFYPTSGGLFGGLFASLFG